MRLAFRKFLHRRHDPLQPDPRVAALLEAGRLEARRVRATGGERTLAAMSATARETLALPSGATSRRSWFGWRTKAAVGLALGMFAMGGGLAAAGHLPDPLQSAVHDGLDHVGIHVPDPHDHHQPDQHAPTESHDGDHSPGPHPTATPHPEATPHPIQTPHHAETPHQTATPHPAATPHP